MLPLRPDHQITQFPGAEEALDYAWNELLDTLRDDLERMRTKEVEHYTDEDRAEMATRIEDLESIEHRVCLRPDPMPQLWFVQDADSVDFDLLCEAFNADQAHNLWKTHYELDDEFRSIVKPLGEPTGKARAVPWCAE